MPRHAPRFRKEDIQVNNFKGTVKRLLQMLAQYRVRLTVVIVLAICSTIFRIFGPYIVGLATTELFEGLKLQLNGLGGIAFDKVYKILGWALVLYLSAAAFTMTQNWIMSGLTQTICYTYRQKITEKIHRMPMGYFESHVIGDALSRITNDVDTLGENLNQTVSQFLVSFTTMLGVFFMMLYINPLMTGLVVLIVPLSGILIMRMMKYSQKYFTAYQNGMGDLNGQVEEAISGFAVIRAFHQEDRFVNRFSTGNDIVYEAAWKSQFFSGMMHPIMSLIGNLGYIVVVIVGSYLAMNGRLTVGNIQAFIQYVRNFTRPISEVAQVSNMLQAMVAASERIFTFLDEEEETQPEKPIAIPKIIDGHVRFSNVQFGYHSDKQVLHDFSVEIQPGQTVAIVGETGAGKTTIVKLLMRFYDIQSGKILIDEQPIQSYRREDLRQMFGMVLQDTWLFKGTIMENIRYGRLEATDEEVIEAAKAAHAHHFIQTLPGGYQMELNEDATNVSQGQRQLLTIARAILANKPILILDEATSSVDTRTELQIQQAMDRLMDGRTSFVIAHRLSTIQGADMILVMKDGYLIERGTHEELLQQQGYYAELYQSQFENDFNM